MTAPVLPPSGYEGPTPAYHRCRTCRGPVETYRPAEAPRMLRAKRHADTRFTDFVCGGSFGPVDVDADLYGGAR